VAFRRNTYQRPPVAPPKPLARPVRLAQIGDEVRATPKGVKAKPGKRAPTVEESRWIAACIKFGCVACWIDGMPGGRPTAYHHILRGGQRLGHLYGFGLCDPGHHQNGGALGLTSRHPYKARFVAIYGGELEILMAHQRRLGFEVIIG